MTSVTRISHNPANSNGPKSVCNREGSGGRERDEGKGQAKVGNEGTAPFPQKTLQEKDYLAGKSSGRRVAVRNPGTSIPMGLGEKTSGHLGAVSAVPATSLLCAGLRVLFKGYNVLCMLKLLFQKQNPGQSSLGTWSINRPSATKLALRSMGS